MATIGSLALILVATTDKFVKGIDAAQGRLGRFVNSIKTSTALIGGAAAAGIASMVRTSIAAVDALGDLAANLNISVEAMQALNYATKQLGGSEQALHAGLSRLNRLLGGAASGSAAAAGAFNQLGLSTQELLKQPLEQQFLSIVDAIRKLPTAAQQADAAQNIFGKGAKDLMGVINAGSESIRGMGDELAKLGGILTEQEVTALGEAENAIAKVTAQLDALKNKLVASFAPEISDSMGLVSMAIEAAANRFKQLEVVGSAIFEVIARHARMLASVINTVLPKRFEVDTQMMDQFIDSLKIRRKELLNELRGLDDKGGGNPLQQNSASNADQKKVEQNTGGTLAENRKQTALLERLANQPPVQFATAAVG
jgi:hypothetical protein